MHAYKAVVAKATITGLVLGVVAIWLGISAERAYEERKLNRMATRVVEQVFNDLAAKFEVPLVNRALKGNRLAVAIDEPPEEREFHRGLDFETRYRLAAQ